MKKKKLLMALGIVTALAAHTAHVSAQDMLRPVVTGATRGEKQSDFLSDAALTRGKGGTSTVDVQLIKYYVDYGYNRSLPLWVGTSLPTSSRIDKDKVVDTLLSPTGGLIYAAFTPTGEDGKVLRQWREYEPGTTAPPDGICSFEKNNEQGNGCFWWYRVGAKVGEAPTNTNNDSTRFFAGYAGIGGHFQFPVYEADHKTGAGVALAGMSLNAGVIGDAKKLEFAFGQRPKSVYLTLDLDTRIQILKQFSFKAGWTLANTDRRIGKRAFMSFQLEH